MSAADPVVGAAFVEIHARASADLDREMSQTVNQATARINKSGAFDDDGSVKAAREGLKYWKTELENVDTSDLTKVRDLQESVAGWQEAVSDRTKIAGLDLDEMGRKGTRGLSGIAAAASAAQPIILAVGAAAALAIAAFQDQALKGLFGPEDRAEAEAFRGELGELSEGAQRFAATVGAELVPALTETLEILNDVLGVVNDNEGAIRTITRAVSSTINPLGEARRQWREWRGEQREASETVEGLTDSVTLLTLAQARNTAETERAAKSQEAATRELDRRIGATVTALQAELERKDAADAIGDALRELAAAEAEVADVQGRNERGARRVADAYRAVRDALQAVADAQQNSLEADRKVAEMRRKLADAQFRMGTGSQEALDAAEDLQEAEYEAGRAREEAGDAADDVKAKEQDLAEARAKQAEEAEKANKRLEDAHEALDDAVRASAQVEADYRIAVREAAGETVSARDKLAIYGEELDKAAPKTGALRDEVNRLKAALDALPSTKTIEVILNTAEALKNLTDFARQVPDAVGLALTDLATGAPLAGTDPNARAAATTAPTTGTVATRSAAGTVPVVEQYVTETADPLHLAHELGWIYTP